MCLYVPLGLPIILLVLFKVDNSFKNGRRIRRNDLLILSCNFLSILIEDGF